MHRLCCSVLLAAAATALFAQDDCKSIAAKHLKISRDFSVKVAEAMPEANYDFKLTPPQMSFGQQMVHLSQGLEYFLSSFTGQKPDPGKPKSMHKDDIVAFVKTSYENAIERVSSLTPEQLHKTYKTEEGEMSGLDVLFGMLDHCTHHRASAEMYLRAKGITPPEYQF